MSMTSRVECLMPKIILSREAAGSFATSAASEYMKMSQQLEKIVESKEVLAAGGSTIVSSKSSSLCVCKVYHSIYSV